MLWTALPYWMLQQPIILVAEVMKVMGLDIKSVLRCQETSVPLGIKCQWTPCCMNQSAVKQLLGPGRGCVH